MVESTATIKLRAVDTGVVSTINGISASSTNALLGATALAGGFKLLEKASSTSVAQLAVGANTAQVLTDTFGKLSTAGNKTTAVLGKISTAAFRIQQVAIAADGVGRAAEQYARLPQAMQAMQASGVSTYSIQQFNTLTEAIRGSDMALDSLLVSSISELGEFEKAASRAGTILKSSLRFDDSGNALTANADERLQNAISAQDLVNNRLNNSVTSTEALGGQYEVLSSGFTNALESQAVLEEGLKLVGIGKAGGKSVNTTATLQLLTKTMNAYELQAGDAAKTAAILNATVENGLTTIQELSNNFGATAAQAGKANISLVDLAASTSVLTAQGTSTAEALTGIARLSASIISKTPEAEKELGKLQIRGEKIRFDKAEIQAKGFTQALIDLYDAAGGSSEILTKIFPEDVAYRTANALLTEQGKRLSSTKELISGADKQKLNEIFEVAQSDRVARFERLANRFKESIIEIGRSLAPTLEPGIKALETIANKFAGLPEPVRAAIGSYLAFRIQSKAVGSAASILVKTLIGLASNYLMVRVLSLALTGQLGKEAKAIKGLIVQKKGLTAATLQLFGIDQKWRLEQVAGTAAIAKQGKVAQLAAAAKTKAAATVKTGVVKGVAATSGITKETAVAELNKRKASAIALANTANIKARQLAQKTADRFGFELPAALAVPPVLRTAPAPPVLRTAPAPPILVGQTAMPAVIAPATAGAVGATAGAVGATAGTGAGTGTGVPRLNRLQTLVAADKTVVGASSEYTKVQSEYDKISKQRKGVKAATKKAAKAADKAEVALAEARNKAITATTGKQEALNEVTKKQQKLKSANNVLAQKEAQFRQINTASMVQKNRLSAAETKLESARSAAKAKYLPLSKASAIAELREQRAIAASLNAKVAKLKADKAEIALGKKSKITMMLRRNARLAEISATKAQAVATKKKAVVTALETKQTLTQTLAEQGLYQTKIFGQTVRLSEVGLMGKINKLLTLNILKVNASAIAEIGLTKAKAALVLTSKALNYQIGVETVKLGALKGIRALESAYLLLKAGATKAGGAIAGVLAPLGALAPLLGVAAIATIVLRDEFFGLGRDVRKATKDYEKFLKEQDNLNSAIAKRTGLTAIEGMIGGSIYYEKKRTVDVTPELTVDRSAINQGIANAEVGIKKAAKVAVTPVKVGKFVLDGAGNLIFGKEEQYTPLNTDSPIAKQLIELKDIGAITTSEFSKLSAAFNKTGKGGHKAAENLAAFRSELKRVKADAIEVEKSLNTKIFEGIKSSPSKLFDRIDLRLNQAAARFQTVITSKSATAAFFKGEYVAADDIQESREVGKLIEISSRLEQQQKRVFDRFIETKYAIADYRDNLALTSVVQTKVAKGMKITSADLNNEEAAYKERADKNRVNIDQLEVQIAESRKNLEKIKSEEGKERLEKQIKLATQEKEALEAEGEALKQLAADTKEYLAQTLPAIRTALQENSNPILALSNASEQFNLPFLKDGEGRVTKLLKPIEILRDEGSKLIGQVQENLSLGLFDNLGDGEALAAERIRAIQNNQISFMLDSEEKTGYRYGLNQRREIASIVIGLENASLQRVEARNKIEIQLAKALQDARLETAETTSVKLAQMQNVAINTRITQKENEIAEFRKLGLRTIAQEIELEQLLVQGRSAGFSLESAELQAEQQERRFALSKAELAISQQALSSSKLLANISLENKILGSNLQKYQKRLQLQTSITRLSESISQNEVFNAELQEKIAIAKINSQRRSRFFEQELLENQIAITIEQNEQQLIQAQSKEDKLELAKLEAEEQFSLSRKNNASSEQLERLKLQVQNADLNLEQARNATEQIQLGVDIQGELNRRTRQQFEAQKQIESSSNAIALSRSQLNQTEAQITQEYNLQTAAIELRSKESSIRAKEANSIVDFRTGELNLAQKVASSEKDKLKIAQQLAALKLNSLKSQIASEAQVLAINQQQAQLQLKSKQRKTGAELQQNVADVIRVEANIKKLQADGASKSQVEAEQAQLQAAIAQRQSLLFRSTSEKEEARLLNLSQKVARSGFARQSEIRVDSERVEAIGSLPEEKRKRAARRLFNEFRGNSGAGISTPAVTSIVDSLKNFKIEVPNLKIPALQLPSLDDIRSDVKAIVSEFKVNPPRSDSYLNTFEGEGKKFVIQNLSMDSPINITIAGGEKEEIAQSVEVAVNNTMTDLLLNLEQNLS